MMNKTTSRLKLFAIAAALIGTGWLLGSLIPGNASHNHSSGSESQASASVWTCSMHPQVQQPQPGKCPICAMDLIPLTAGGKGSDRPRVLKVTESAKKLAKIETVPVVRKLLQAEIRLVGKVDYDETKTKTLAARFPARIDQLYVDYTGIEVHQGDHLARVYSPELLTAQQELLSALKFRSNIETARDKLRLWDLSEDKIKAIETRRTPTDQMDIDAPLGGIVVNKHVTEGQYLKTGEPLFDIADLSTVWIQLDAYESDIPWLRYGQPVQFTAKAVPGRQFQGTVAFIAPTMNSKTRTVDVRVNAENPSHLLKPDMFVQAIVFPTLAAGGKVIAPNLKDKWISPMHPEVVRDEPGFCPVCGMALVKPEKLGYAVVSPPEQPPLIIPSSAVLRTGKRSVVYVELPERDQPTYEGREILIGPRAGDFYIVEEGLMEGELVVSQGNFKIDSALQIVAKPSMMNPEGGATGGGHDHGDMSPAADASYSATPTYDVAPLFHDQIHPIYVAYFNAQESLAEDALSDTKPHGKAMLEALRNINMGLLEGEAHMAWMNYLAPIRGSAAMLAEAVDLEQARVAFLPLSRALIDASKTFKLDPGTNVVEVNCPMAFDNQGGTWLQLGEDVRNPYFGMQMLKCGDVVSHIGAKLTQFEVDEKFREQLGALVHSYLKLQSALAADDFPAAKTASDSVSKALEATDMSLLESEAHIAWMKSRASIASSIEVMSNATAIADLRVAFESLSNALTLGVKAFQPLGVQAIYQAHCPMAFDNKGASWLQSDKNVLNPYFGAAMLHCGSIKQELLQKTDSSERATHEH